MASTYPTSLDVFTNPLAANPLTAPSHAQQHSDLNDAVEALEAKVAIGNTVLGTYTAYTPTFTNLTVGNGTVVGAYARTNDFAHVYGSITLGSTSSVTGSVSIVLPINISASMSLSSMSYGSIFILDTSAVVRYVGTTRYNATSNSVFAGSFGASSTDAFFTTMTATTPITWATSDILTWNLYYRAA